MFSSQAPFTKQPEMHGIYRKQKKQTEELYSKPLLLSTGFLMHRKITVFLFQLYPSPFRMTTSIFTYTVLCIPSILLTFCLFLP